MAAKKAKPSRGRYAAELERLRDLNAINEVLKKSDIENAALTNTSKDSETVNDNVLDNMLDQLNVSKNANKDLGIVEGLANQKTTRATPVKRHARAPRVGKRAIRAKRKPQHKRQKATHRRKKR
ncbi:MAG: hypothetical protein ABSE71_01245 [Candidatus Micrarchaeaceae archaeon]|jgi:hypothetical protein|nr:hypothetical protein [Candidatus Micrarchaeota archaeon]HII09750.1 hypothetical protein [Candidatus Micrarchaeota archaeon]